jgi:sugar (pentulose or hexulose) kinase
MTGISDRLVVGIDLGTSGARCAILTEAGELVATRAIKLSAFTSDHRDPHGWWLAVSAVLNECLDQVDRRAVCAIAFDGTSGTILPVNDKGEPLANPLMYNDPVQDEVINKRISQHAPKASAAHGATSGLAKVLVFQSVPDVFRILHQADWLAGRFIDDYTHSDENNALKTGYDPVEGKWPDWIAKTGARLDFLPIVVPAGDPIGKIASQIAAEFDLPKDVVVVAGTTDGCAAFLATGATNIGDGVTSLGTTLTIKILSDKPIFAPEFGVYSHKIWGMWLPGGASNSGGAVLANYFTGDEISDLSGQINPHKSSGLNYYPLCAPGERFPINDPSFPPQMEPRPKDDVAFLQAIFEGIASIELAGYQQLQAQGAPALITLRSLGTGAGNSVWTEIRQKKINVPFISVASHEAAIGTARLGLSGAKIAGRL